MPARARSIPDLLDGVIKGAEGDSTIKILNPQRLLRDEFSRLGVSGSARRDRASGSRLRLRRRRRLQPRAAGLAGQLRSRRSRNMRCRSIACARSSRCRSRSRRCRAPETAVLGVVTLRDRLLPLVSLRALLGLPADSEPRRARQGRGAVDGKGAVGVVADRTREILRVDPDVDRSGAGAADARRRAMRKSPRSAASITASAWSPCCRRIACSAPIWCAGCCRSRAATSDASSSQTDGNAMADEQFIIFRLGDQEYGMPIAAVDEIARPPEQIARLPKAPAFVDGVMNLRGIVVPIVDLRRRFEIALEGTGQAASAFSSWRLVGERRVSWSTASRKFMKVAGQAPSVRRPEVSAEQMRLIGRVANLDAQDRMILLVDPAQLLDQIEADVLAKFDRSAAEQDIEGFVIKLLIADDSALMRKLLEGIFREEGDFDIRLARNGTEALELVRSFDPQVVTLDVQMPGMDGLTCLGQIMIEAPRPVVMISSLTEEGAEATLEAIELGAVDFVAKPSGTVSLEIDRLRPILVEKVRGAANARIRRTLRSDGAHPPSVPRRRRAAAPAAAATRGRATSASKADPAPGLVLIGTSTGGPAALDVVLPQLPPGFPWPVMVAQHMPASFHRAVRQAARPAMRAAGGRGRPSDAAAGRHDLYRPGRRRSGRGAAVIGHDRHARAGAARLSLASQRRAHGDERAGALRRRRG